MEHSLQAYLQRQSTDVLEKILQRCLCDECSYAIPIIQEILEQRKQAKAESRPMSLEDC